MALVLTRKEGESIEVGNATVTIARITGGRVRVLIAAPPEVNIRRSELKPIDRGGHREDSTE
jgi:carbon storage regulator CsrA